MIVVAALGTRFGITAGPDALVDGVDRLLLGRRVPAQQRTERCSVETALGQRVVETARATAVRRLEAEVRQRGDCIARQHGVAQLEQGISPTIEAVIQSRAEGAQACKVM